MDANGNTPVMLRIGFVGKIDIVNGDVISSCLSGLFAAIAEKFPFCQLHFVSGLADGADQIAAQIFIDAAWLKPGDIDRLSMGAIIAFPKEDYLNTIKDKTCFNKLYDRCIQKLVLDGKYQPGDEGAEQRKKAHRQQGSILSRTIDLLIAVTPAQFDGNISNSLETVISSLHKSVPVILLNLNDNRFYFYKDIEAWSSNNEAPSDAVTVIGHYLESGSFPQHSSGLAHCLVCEPGTNSKGSIFWLREKSWNLYESIFKKRMEKSSLAMTGDINNGSIENPLSVCIAKERKRLSEFSKYCQLQYRGGYILNYMLALLAVFIAVVSIVVYLYLDSHSEDTIGYWLIALLGIIKALLIWAIIKNTKDVNSALYNRDAIDYRYASERMRINYYLSFLGIMKAPEPSLGHHTQHYLLNYGGEVMYKRNISSIVKTPFDIKLSKRCILDIISFLKENWFTIQDRYHEGEQEKMSSMHDRLEKASGVFSTTVLVIILTEVLVVVLGDICHVSVFSLAAVLSPLFMGLATLIPAIVTTLNGLIFQTEAKKISFRSMLIRQEIKKPMNDLLELERSIPVTTNGCDVYSLLKIIDEMSCIMIDEVAEWSMLYEKNLQEQG